MKIFTGKETALAACLLAAFSIPALGQFAVIDVSAIAKAVQEIKQLSAQYTQMVNQYNQLVRTYTMINNQYNQMVANARGLANLPQRFIAPFTKWTYPHTLSRYGTSNGWVDALLNGSSSSGYGAATLPLGAYDWSFISADAQTTDSLNYSTIELTDGLTQTSMTTIGSIQANASAAEDAIQRLEANTDNAAQDPSEVQALQNIGSADVIALRNQQDTNKLLAILMEQQTIGQKAQRDAFAQSVANEIAYSNHSPQHQNDMFFGTDDAMNQLGVLP